MPSSLHWIQHASTGRWHAWPVGGRETLCGRINVEHLRQHPAAQIKSVVDPEEQRCVRCSSKAGLGARAIKDLDTIQAMWVGTLRRHLKARRIKLGDPCLVSLAKLLAEVGPPGTAEAQAVFDQVEWVLLRPTWKKQQTFANIMPTHTRYYAILPHLKDALDKIPPNTKALARIADTVRQWREITRCDPALAKFHSDRVVETILQVQSPEPYIRYFQSRGHPELAFIFHPNTLQRAQKDPALRGLFTGSTDYWDHTEHQLRVLTD